MYKFCYTISYNYPKYNLFSRYFALDVTRQWATFLPILVTVAATPRTTKQKQLMKNVFFLHYNTFSREKTKRIMNSSLNFRDLSTYIKACLINQN